MEKLVISLLDLMFSMSHQRLVQITDLQGKLHMDISVTGIRREGGTNIYIVSVLQGSVYPKSLELCVKAI